MLYRNLVYNPAPAPQLGNSDRYIASNDRWVAGFFTIPGGDSNFGIMELNQSTGYPLTGDFIYSMPMSPPGTSQPSNVVTPTPYWQPNHYLQGSLYGFSAVSKQVIISPDGNKIFTAFYNAHQFPNGSVSRYLPKFRLSLFTFDGSSWTEDGRTITPSSVSDPYSGASMMKCAWNADSTRFAQIVVYNQSTSPFSVFSDCRVIGTTSNSMVNSSNQYTAGPANAYPTSVKWLTNNKFIVSWRNQGPTITEFFSLFTATGPVVGGSLTKTAINSTVFFSKSPGVFYDGDVQNEFFFVPLVGNDFYHYSFDDATNTFTNIAVTNVLTPPASNATAAYPFGPNRLLRTTANSAVNIYDRSGGTFSYGGSSNTILNQNTSSITYLRAHSSGGSYLAAIPNSPLQFNPFPTF